MASCSLSACFGIQNVVIITVITSCTIVIVTIKNISEMKM